MININTLENLEIENLINDEVISNQIANKFDFGLVLMMIK
jgi:hypothetical protein